MSSPGICCIPDSSCHVCPAGTGRRFLAVSSIFSGTLSGCSEFKHLARYLAFQHVKHEVFPSNDATVTKHRLYRLLRQFRMIVFITQMAQPHMVQSRGGILHKCLRTGFIAQVSVGAADTFLQMAWIRACFQFLRFMIGFNHKIV